MARDLYSVICSLNEVKIIVFLVSLILLRTRVKVKKSQKIDVVKRGP